MQKPNQSKLQTVNEDRIVRLYLILIVLGLLAVYLVYYHIKYDLPANTMLDVMTSFNKLSVFIYLMLTLFLIELIRWLLYRRKVRNIMLHGTSCTGTVLDTVCLTHPLNGHAAFSRPWKYSVRLPDGTTVLTEAFTFNFYYELRNRKCTVYEYRGKYYFTDFN